PDRRPGGADPWRFGVHARGPGRAAVPRRAPVPDLRGHQPDPATRHRPGDAAVALRECCDSAAVVQWAPAAGRRLAPAAGRRGIGISRRLNALDSGLHAVPAGPAHPDHDADGAGVACGVPAGGEHPAIFPLPFAVRRPGARDITALETVSATTSPGWWQVVISTHCDDWNT